MMISIIPCVSNNRVNAEVEWMTHCFMISLWYDCRLPNYFNERFLCYLVPFWFRAVVFCPILRHIFQLLYIKPTYNKTIGKCFITKLSVEAVHSFDTFDRVTEHLGHRLRRKQARRVQSPEHQDVITTLYMTCSFDLSQSLLLLQSKSQELCGKECFQCMLLHALLKRRGHTAAGRQRQLFVFTKIRSLDMVAKNAKQKGFQCKPC